MVGKRTDALRMSFHRCRCMFRLYQKIKVSGSLYCKWIDLISSLGHDVQVGVTSARGVTCCTHRWEGTCLEKDSPPRGRILHFLLESSHMFRMVKSPRPCSTGGIHHASPSGLQGTHLIRGSLHYHLVTIQRAPWDTTAICTAALSRLILWKTGTACP